MLQISPRLRQAIDEVELAAWYASFNRECSLAAPMSVEPSQVLTLLDALGLDARYNKQEKFFSLRFERDTVASQFNLSLQRGRVEMIYSAWFEERLEEGSAPLSRLYRALTGERLADPVFRDLEELHAILKSVIDKNRELLDALVGATAVEEER